MNIASGHDEFFPFGLAETKKSRKSNTTVNTTVNADKAVYFTAGGVVALPAVCSKVVEGPEFQRRRWTKILSKFPFILNYSKFILYPIYSFFFGIA